jgi:hypothetical protein
MGALTDTEIKRAKAAEEAYSMGDGGGLYLWVKPTGGQGTRRRASGRLTGRPPTCRTCSTAGSPSSTAGAL